jgi:hypothetical protein
MADLGAGRERPSAWQRLTEERFTNVDIMLVLGALLITCFVGAISGVTLFR